jgi:hypothetical protein
VAEDRAYADDVRRGSAMLMGRIAAVVRAFGRLVRAEVEGSGVEEAELTAALAALRLDRSRAEAVLLTDPRGQHGLWELNSAVLTATDRAVQELDDAGHERLRSEQAHAVQPGRRAAHAVGRLRTTSRQLGERVDLTKRVNLVKRVRRSERPSPHAASGSPTDE